MSLDKVLVVGAGLSGLLTSYVMLRRGFRVELLEEHDSIGLPRHCSGLVSDYVAGFLGGLAREHVMSRFTEYSVKVVEGNEVHEAMVLSFRNPVHLIDRVGLEKSLCEVVISLGGGVSMKTIATDVNLSRNLLVTSRGLRHYDLVVISEGATRRLVRSLNLCRASEYLIGSQAFLSVVESPETVEVITSPFLDPGGFGWVIPVSEKRVILGLATTSRKANLLLRYFAKKIFKSSSSYRVESFFGGLIPADRPCEKIAGKNYVLVGDATSVIKPVSKGGIYPLIEEVIALRDSLDKGSLIQDYMTSKYGRLLNYLKTQHVIHETILSVGGYYKLVKSLARSGLRKVKILDYDKLVTDPATSFLLALSADING